MSSGLGANIAKTNEDEATRMKSSGFLVFDTDGTPLNNRVHCTCFTPNEDFRCRRIFFKLPVGGEEGNYETDGSHRLSLCPVLLFLNPLCILFFRNL